jgi:2,3-dihydroxyphenylpropionate 1,2-dioxygenase
MTVQLICCSHSPLMTTDIEESQTNVHAEFFRELDSCATELRAFDPDLVVVFGPDHFNGFFYELMPAFCIGTSAESSKDWHLESGPLRVPRELALSCVRFLQSRDFDVAISHQMKVDHGMTIPLYQLTGALARYDVLPVFVNCAADPRPSFRRVRAFGQAIGEFLADQNMRITVVGSGGFSVTGVAVVSQGHIDPFNDCSPCAPGATLSVGGALRAIGGSRGGRGRAPRHHR